MLTNQISALRVDNGSYSTAGINIPRLLREAGTRFHSSRSNGEKAAVAGGWGSLGRTHGGYFTYKLLESDMEKYGKLLFSSFVSFVHGVLPAYNFVSNGTRLGMDGYLLWLLAVAQSCYSFWSAFPAAA